MMKIGLSALAMTGLVVARRRGPGPDVPVPTEVPEPTLREYLRADLAALAANIERLRGEPVRRPLLSALLHNGFQAVVTYRVSHALYERGHKRLAWAMCMVGLWINGAEFDPSARIGPGLVVTHPLGSGSYAHRIGRNCTINARAGFGMSNDGYPTVGDDVFLGADAYVMGKVHIGDGAVIGTKALVLCDVPAGHRAYGVPARIFPPKCGDEG
jgi:serine O-acetyltransferase